VPAVAAAAELGCSAREEATMEYVSRRDLFGISSLAGIAALTSGTALFATEKGRATEVFAIGPLPLGSWFQRATSGKWPGDKFETGICPDMDKVIADLNTSPLFILDVRNVAEPNRPKFVEAKEFPLLVVGSRATHEWKVKGSTVTLSIGKMTIGVNYVGNSPPSKTLRAGIELEMRGTDGRTTVESTFGMSQALTYEIKGDFIVNKRE
jgi:hypothetical protein